MEGNICKEVGVIYKSFLFGSSMICLKIYFFNFIVFTHSISHMIRLKTNLKRTLFIYSWNSRVLPYILPWGHKLSITVSSYDVTLCNGLTFTKVQDMYVYLERIPQIHDSQLSNFVYMRSTVIKFNFQNFAFHEKVIYHYNKGLFDDLVREQSSLFGLIVFYTGVHGLSVSHRIIDLVRKVWSDKKGGRSIV